ncbi:Rmf/CrpP family protein [Rhizobium terrae]|uniref:Rmf/CrpP family protein n=1 Tax=Rhizobium terrae TaxID=2171756 RepID=UPI0038574E84
MIGLAKLPPPLCQRHDPVRRAEKKIFKEGQDAAELGRSMRTCPYLTDEAPERMYTWMGGFWTRKR